MKERSFFVNHVNHIKIVFVIETVLLALMLAFILFLLQSVKQSSAITVTPPFSSGYQATTVPDNESTPTITNGTPKTVPQTLPTNFRI